MSGDNEKRERELDDLFHDILVVVVILVLSIPLVLGLIWWRWM